MRLAGVRGHADRHGERGAVLVHAAVAMTGLLAFSALTIDLGALWVSRGQAQNTVDAAALAGTVSLAYGNAMDDDAAVASARVVAQTHSIWGDPVTAASLTITPGACPAGSPAIPGECVTVGVTRSLPVFFSRLFGAGATTVSATASGKVVTGNTSTCVRPLAIMDSWMPWAVTDRFSPPDSYTPPSPSGTGTGRTDAALNVRINLGRGDVQQMTPPIDPAGNEYFKLDISRVGSPNGTGDYGEREQRFLDNMEGCNAVPVEIGESVSYWDEGGEETIAAAQALIDTDPGAYWDGTMVRGSAFQVSPRILTIALVDPQYFRTQQALPIQNRRYLIRNLVGFFLEATTSPVPGLDEPLVGVLMKTRGAFDPTADNVAPGSAFLTSVELVR